MAVQKTYAIVLGIVLLLLGIWGFIPGQAPILGIFGVNTAQNILHLAGGVLGLWLGMKNPKGFNLWLGWIALAGGILGFIPVASDLLVRIFDINSRISWLHIAVGVVSLLVGYAVKE